MSSFLSAFAESFINNLTSVEIVGIFDTDLNSIFPNAQYIKADLKEPSRIMKHPVETGTIIADNRIIDPIEINMSIMIQSRFYSSLYNQIKQAQVNATSLIVQTRTGVYSNIIIQTLSHQEDADIFDAVVMNVHLEEVLYIVPTSVSSQPAPANFSPADPDNTDTIQAGLKSPATVTTANQTAVNNSLITISSQN